VGVVGVVVGVVVAPRAHNRAPCGRLRGFRARAPNREAMGEWGMSEMIESGTALVVVGLGKRAGCKIDTSKSRD